MQKITEIFLIFFVFFFERVFFDLLNPGFFLFFFFEKTKKNAADLLSCTTFGKFKR